MKKILLVFLLVFLMSGCSHPFFNNEPSTPSSSTGTKTLFSYADPITINDVIKALQTNGVKLEQTDFIKPADFTFDGITPVVYEMNNSGHYLLIYDYKTIIRLKEGWGDDFFPNERYYPDVEPMVSYPYTAKNILLIMRLNADQLTDEKWTELNGLFKNVNKARYEMNDAKTYTYAGHSKNFDGILKVIGYKYWYKDENGYNQLDQNAQQKWEIRYLGPDPKSIHDLHYRLSVSGDNGSSYGNMDGPNILNKIGSDYYLPRLGSNHNCPDIDTIYTIKIKLNNQKTETLELRNIQPALTIFMNESFNAAFLKSLET